MRNSLKALLCAFVLGALTTGCAVNRSTASVDPTAKLDSMKTIHVRKLAADQRGVDQLIADNLRKRGYTVTAGPGPSASSVDATVTYADKWIWDITMYMLELTVQFREPATDYPLATGNSFHTSLTRKSPPEMVDEVIDNILKESKKK